MTETKKQKKPSVSSVLWTAFYHDFTRLRGLRQRGMEHVVSDFAEKYKDIPVIPPRIIKKILNFQNDPDRERSGEIASWVFNSEKDSDDTMKALALIFSRGVSPVAYLKHMGASILGLAAYTGKTDIVEMSYQYATPEECRLILSRETTHDPEYFGSTLLHRLAERNAHPYVMVMDVIMRHDPYAVMQKTEQGAYPENLSRDPSIKKKMNALRVELARNDLKTGVLEGHEDRIFAESKVLKM